MPLVCSPLGSACVHLELQPPVTTSLPLVTQPRSSQITQAASTKRQQLPVPSAFALDPSLGFAIINLARFITDFWWCSRQQNRRSCYACSLGAAL